MTIYSRKNRAVHDFWDTLTGDMQREFERRHGSWQSFADDEERYAVMNGYITSLRQEDQEERMRILIEEKFNSLRQSYQDTLDVFGREIKSAVQRIEEKASQPHFLPSYYERPLLPEPPRQITSAYERPQSPEPPRNITPEKKPDAQPQKIFIPVITWDDCRYDGNKGPKHCMKHVERDGGTYVSCTVAEQINARRMTSFLFTTMLEKCGCPSNPIVRRCQYLDRKEIKI